MSEQQEWDYTADNEDEYYGVLDEILRGAATKAKEIRDRVHELKAENAALKRENEALKDAMRITIYANEMTSKCNMKYLHRALLTAEEQGDERGRTNE